MNKLFSLISALQKSIRWCDVNASRYFARELVEMGCPGAVFNRLMIIAAEDVGLADPTLVEYESKCLRCFDNMIKEYGIIKREVIYFPDICEVIDRAVIAAALSYKSRLLPMISFTTLFDIYKKEKFDYNVNDYLDRFEDSVELNDEKLAVYYGYVVAIYFKLIDRLFEKIQRQSVMRNERLVREWLNAYKCHGELLFLAGSIVLLCRELDFSHGEYINKIDKQISISIKPTTIPDRAYDMHTGIGKRRGRSFKHFFTEGASVKNERFVNDWEMIGRNAYYLADSQGLGKAAKVIDATKAKFQERVSVVMT